MDVKLPISALVASYSEAHLLEDCLKSIQFCDEIVVVNLNSRDSTEEIAKKYCTGYYFEAEDLLYFDAYHAKYIPLLKNKWFLLIDPDERIMPALAKSIQEMIDTAPPDYSVIRVPLFNYFKGKRLNGTVYGGLIYARLLYKMDGVFIGKEVHSSIQMKEGYSRKKIQYNGENYDKHYWCTSWKQLFNKHKRYLKGEGMAQYKLGKRYSFKHQIYHSLIKFYYSFKGKQGYKDGLTGLLLSMMAARYEYLSWKSLKQYQNNI